MSVAQAQEDIDSREFAGWLAYNEIDPFGEERADLRAGIIASVTANAFGKRGSSHRPRDFMPDFDRRSRQQTVMEMQHKLRALLQVKD